MTRNLEYLSSRNFDDFVGGSEQPVLVDFYADWCGPCRALAPEIKELAELFDGSIKFAKLNVDNNPEIAERYGVEGIPTLIIFKRGQEIDRVVGLIPKNRLTEYLNTVASKVPPVVAK